MSKLSFDTNEHGIRTRFVSPAPEAGRICRSISHTGTKKIIRFLSAFICVPRWRKMPLIGSFDKIHWEVLMKDRLTGCTHASGSPRSVTIQLLLAVLPALPLLPGCQRQNLDFKSEYQAVFLINGQTFIGKLEGGGSDYPKLTEVFYIQSGVNPETKQVTNVLVKRGKEWHAPDFMYINGKNILVIEPVAPDSQVAKLIKEAKGQNGQGGVK